MTIRVHKRERFTSVSNEIINNKQLSWESRAMLIYLLSKPDGWVMRNTDLIKQSPAGREKVRSIVQELTANGYIFRWKIQGTDGRIEWKSEIFESPDERIEWLQANPNLQVHHDVKTVSGKSEHHDVKTVSGSTVDGEPVDIVSTEFSNTDLDPEILIDLLPYTHSDPERVCKGKEKSPDPESFIIPDTPKTSPVFSSPIGDDNFSAAAPLNSSIEGFPIGPWGRDLFSIDAGFMAAVIAKWRKGDSQKAKTFGAMVDEEVRGCIQKYWRKDWLNLKVDWTEYEESTKRLAQTVRDRMAQGVEITSQEQKILTDRVRGPAHLQIRSTQPIALSPSDFAPQRTIAPFDDSTYPSNGSRCLPVALTGEIDPEELERTKQAIAAARASVKAPDNPVLWTYGKPSEGFQSWLILQAQKNRIEGMTLRATTIGLSQRPEMQANYLKSLEGEA
jgi:hypothetical protein